LTAVQRLDCRVDIENPVLLQQLFVAAFEVSLEPVLARFFVDLLEGSPRRVFADQLAHAQQRRRERVGP